MGEIADMMLDGTLCEGCGGFMGSAGDGYVRYCSACSRDHKTDMQVFNSLKPPQKKVSCPVCKKRVKATGLADHTRDAHKEKP